MKVNAILNNYQMGSYAHRCLADLIMSETRLDKSHTKVVWRLENESQVRLLQRALGNPKRLIGGE
jgi:hypothetical protein